VDEEIKGDNMIRRSNADLIQKKGMKGGIYSMKCKWEKDAFGFYLTPLIGFSKIYTGKWSFWIGWLYWLWTFEFLINKRKVV
jgi:hypothetical protein